MYQTAKQRWDEREHKDYKCLVVYFLCWGRDHLKFIFNISINNALLLLFTNYNVQSTWFPAFPLRTFSSLEAKSEKSGSWAFSEVKRFGDPNQSVLRLAHSEV